MNTSSVSQPPPPHPHNSSQRSPSPPRSTSTVSQAAVINPSVAPSGTATCVWPQLLSRKISPAGDSEVNVGITISVRLIYAVWAVWRNLTDVLRIHGPWPTGAGSKMAEVEQRVVALRVEATSIGKRKGSWSFGLKFSQKEDVYRLIHISIKTRLNSVKPLNYK